MKAGHALRAQADRIISARARRQPPPRAGRVSIDATQRPMVATFRDSRYRLHTWYGGTHLCDRTGQQWMTMEDFLRNEWVKIG